jgi:hypothetical protein
MSISEFCKSMTKQAAKALRGPNAAVAADAAKGPPRG